MLKEIITALIIGIMVIIGLAGMLVFPTPSTTFIIVVIIIAIIITIIEVRNILKGEM